MMKKQGMTGANVSPRRVYEPRQYRESCTAKMLKH